MAQSTSAPARATGSVAAFEVLLVFCTSAARSCAAEQ
jgi:hypothetical protein